jgi:HAD superfamily hydrolase (TIGR01509 family)
MRMKGVVFDFNGTLFWDTDLHNKAWDSFLENKRIILSDQEKNHIIHGKNNQDILRVLFKKSLSKKEIEKYISEKESIYQGMCLNANLQLAPGAIHFLDFLSSNAICFTIATASGPENVDFYFRYLCLDSYFDRSKVIFNDGTIRSKPRPEIFQKAMNIMGLSGIETVIFEDSFAGISAAENAGAGKIIIVNSHNEDYERWSYQKIKNFNEVDKDLFTRHI